MRILFDEGVHNMRNMGNNAMLQTAINRLSHYWPNASIDVLSYAPYLTKLYFSDVHPVSPYDLQRINTRFDPLHGFIPRSLWWFLLELREVMLSYNYKSIKSLWEIVWSRFSSGKQPDYSSTGNNRTDNNEFNEAQYRMTIHDGLVDYDLVVCTGGGVIYHLDQVATLKVLNRLEVAIGLGIPTVMVGQGIGRIKDPYLISRAREIMPQVDLICVRNRQIAVPTLFSLGVPPERVIFTGDDAIEMAYNARPQSLGTSIGVSIRVADYTQVGKQQIELIRLGLQQSAQTRRAELIAVGLSSHHEEADNIFLSRILDGYENTLISRRMLNTPLRAIKRVGQCRLMITGTYHGAVFALAQGIPVIALANSGEYVDKLSEITEEFGGNCQVLNLGDPQLLAKLVAAIDIAWLSAEQWRPTLLERATGQIQLQHAAYKRIYDLVTSKNGGIN